MFSSLVLSKANTLTQGRSVSEMSDLCQNGLSLLITRHPIVRLISSFNDKFGWNSTDGAGFTYGVRLFLRSDYHMKAFFPHSFLFLTTLNLTDIGKTHKGFKPAVVPHTENWPPTQFPRVGKDVKNEWHLIDFSGFVDFLHSQWKKDGKFLTDNHFRVSISFYAKFRFFDQNFDFLTKISIF
mgnify:CR=1 FL=1